MAEVEERMDRNQELCPESNHQPFQCVESRRLLWRIIKITIKLLLPGSTGASEITLHRFLYYPEIIPKQR
jgi:hypothetical protein